MESVYCPGLFQGKSALITGGGSGIGLATARELGRLGARVLIGGRRVEVLEAAAAKLREEGVEVFAGSCDIREPESIKGFLDGALAFAGRVDILVNNAGGQFMTPAEACSPNGFAAVVRNNLLGTWNMTHAVANRAMIPQKGGVIVNVTAQVDRGFPGMVHTGAARAGVENMTKTLAVEWVNYGVRVNAVAPGIIRSSGTDRYPPEMLELARQTIAMKRLGTPEEVSSLITWLCTPGAAFVTGQIFTMDGGQGLWGQNWQL